MEQFSTLKIMKNLKIKFLNHASFYIETESSLTLVDPWYFGKIFNNSWSLLKDTDDNEIDYSKLKYITISHEHPDHLHWPTLKHIRSKTDNNIKILFPKRNNPNVMDECIKLGYEFEYIDYYKKLQLEKDYFLCAFPDGHDSALVYEVCDKIICNQNDAYLNHSTMNTLKNMYPKMDLWLFQFSLAGYYGNSTEPEKIKTNGTQFHINKFIEYQNFFQPIMSVPFASYVYFCKEHNKYINEYSVKLIDILNNVNHQTQIPFYNEEISLNSIDSNIDHLNKWDNILKDSEKNILEYEGFVGEDILIEELDNLVKQGYSIIGGPCILEFFDYEKNLLIDTHKNKFIFIEKNETPSELLAGILPSQELLVYLRTPWGGDTLNITGAFIVKNRSIWSNFLMARERLYIR